ncbi:phosphoribosylanthranilate isomerase [Paenibacillus larvae]|uniref:N-(5'-phosphoribosyl)anthranilate isomerase n=2 Tax=Paenibacillus larvae TaxID=1464 RepID=A0A6C0QQ49_9BACL|nr:phosphoribosylanthranilate isomerase [Paenibacillus larvae]AVF23371.1 N-(5'-phosphoribosyl)anthranilate isomerase TrpF [Paenibacillus larvae subsp. larvae]ETK25944.1 N-(5'-phosphoribosyl)anthranilate isomerase TrpF [Paenibacillus larvae subsp. larvae DSM 25719]MCY7476180.1 phosphoribosylanthranilate isomerase [Paenibacillus larvae]MCY7489022.1 phosphoribosylanthranilate isomerase [Paenibacillus larvae]MCY9561848.1 phosphoribosylanthranilate isomerase [Paenibacillus larvae]
MPDMLSTRIKICGLQSVEALNYLMRLPVSYVGLVFAASKRRIRIDQAAELTAYLRRTPFPDPPKSVGVFVNPIREELTDAVHKAGFDFVQLHGDESPEFCCWVKENLNVGIFKAFCITPDIKKDHTESNSVVDNKWGPYSEAGVDAFLLDTLDPDQQGGTGKTFCWGKLPVYLEWSRRHHVPLFVAGGLNDNNVSELISDYHPYGVDVSSGVETDGWKDPDKIKRFVERVAACG